MISNPSSNETAQAWLLRALSYQQPDAPGKKLRGDENLFEEVISLAEREGVAPLLHHCLGADGLADLFEHQRKRLQLITRQAAASELLAEIETQRAVATMVETGIPFLLLKGTPLAYHLYPAPHLRLRCDTDILFPDRATTDSAFAELAKLGYQRSLQSEGKLVNYQFSCRRETKAGSRHWLDLHWHLNNSQRIAHLFTFNELMAVSESVSSLGDARTLSLPHLLIHANLHRLADLLRGSNDRLICLYDIHLIGEALTPTQWNELIAISQHKQIAWACYQGLEIAQTCFNTQLDNVAMQALKRAGELEPSFMSTNDSQFTMMVAELRAIPCWSDRIRLLWEILFPSARYMTERDGLTSRWQLPAAYVRRIVNGITKRHQKI